MEGDTCTICLIELPFSSSSSPADRNSCTTTCGHRFHLTCMLQCLGLHISDRPEFNCPNCRQELYTKSQYRSIDTKLLRCVSRREWTKMRSLVNEEKARFVARIEKDAYPHDTHCNLGMTALHFAVRDHAPLDVIQFIYHHEPCSMFQKEINDLTPFELLCKITPNTPSYSNDEFLATKLWIKDIYYEKGFAIPRLKDDE